MFPIVSGVISVELIRNGGSLWADYVSTDDKVYRLNFPINLRFLPGEVERLGYFPPVLGRVVIIYRDGIRVGGDLDDVIELTWVAASELLRLMKPYIDDGKMFERKWFEQMVFVADHEGILPPDVVPKAKTFRISDLPLNSERSDLPEAPDGEG